MQGNIDGPLQDCVEIIFDKLPVGECWRQSAAETAQLEGFSDFTRPN